ncbi:MAG: ATP-dependent sacrificial sulfur transferase LarE [Acidimicrobiales bacterium]
MSSGERALLSAVAGYSKLVVAFSGGVDSALLAIAARKALGRDSVQAVTADSASLATGEADNCRDITQRWDIPWISVQTTEFDDERYLRNDTDRCFWCKTALMRAVEPIARASGATVALGVNVDDLGDHRPGQNAAAERGAVFPLVEAGLTKDDVRRIAKNWGIEVWDRPAMPCLSSRVPYGTGVTVELVSRIDRAEHALRSLGFNDVRVRHYQDTARIEVPVIDLAKAVELSNRINSDVMAAGYRYVTLDLAGLRSGNLNHGITL